MNEDLLSFVCNQLNHRNDNVRFAIPIAFNIFFSLFCHVNVFKVTKLGRVQCLCVACNKFNSSVCKSCLFKEFLFSFHLIRSTTQ